MHQAQQHTYATPYMTPVEPQLFGQPTHQLSDQNQSFAVHTLQVQLSKFIFSKNFNSNDLVIYCF